MKTKACAQCPWRKSNQGKKHKFGFYTKANLRRLWNQIRGGGGQQSCHLTDPSHPDHVSVGAKATATAQECPGSIVLISRELKQMADDKGVITVEGMTRYRKERKKGLTKSGLAYWIVSRIQFGGTVFGGPKFPDIPDDTDVDLPAELETG